MATQNAKKMTIRDTGNIIDQVNFYATQRGLTQQEAVIRLLQIGLQAENDSIYTSDLSRAITAAVREELTAVKAAMRTELREVSSTIDDRLASAEAAAYASLFATLKGDMGEPAPIAADIFAIAGNRYAAGEDMNRSLKYAKNARQGGERR